MPDQTAEQILPAPQIGQDSDQSEEAPPEATRALRASLEGQLGMGELENIKSLSVQARPYFKVLEDPQSSPEDKDNAYLQLSRIYKSKPAKEKLSRAQQIQGILGKLGSFITGLTPAGAEAQAKQRELTQLGQQREREIGQQSQARIGEEEAKFNRERAGELADFNKRKLDIDARVKSGEITSREGAELLWRQSLPSMTNALGTRKQLGFQLPNGDKMYVQWDQKTGKYYDNKNEEVVIPDGAIPLAPITSGVPRVIGKISASVAKNRAKIGETFLNEAGTPINVDSLTPEMELVATTLGGRTYYTPLSQNQTHFPVGGRMYAVPTLEQINMKGGAGVELGSTQIPSTSTRQEITIGTGGEAVPSTLTATRTPITSGIPGRPSPGETALPAPTTAPAPAPAQGTAPPPVAAPVVGGVPRPQVGAGASPASSGGGKGGIRGLPSGAYNQIIQVVRPVTEAANRIFGDPARPDAPSLAKYGDLANDPKSRSRLGRAIQLTYDQMEASGGGGKGDTFWSWVKNESGFTAALAAARAKVMSGAVGILTPREVEYMDAFIASMSTIVGLRSISRASAARYSVALLEQELPAIGRGTTSSTQYYDKLEQLAGVVKAATKGTDKSGVWPAADLAYVQALPDKMAEMKKSANVSDRVSVISPSGKLGTIPRSQLKAALAQGYKEKK